MALIRRRRDATPRRSEVAVTRPNPWLAAAGENGPASEEPRRRCAWLHHGSDARGCPPRASHTEYKVAARSSPPDGRLASDCLDRAGAVDGPAPPASWWSSGAGPSTAIPPSKDHASGKRTVWQNLSLTPRVPYKGWGEGQGSPSIVELAPHPNPDVRSLFQPAVIARGMLTRPKTELSPPMPRSRHQSVEQRRIPEHD